MEHKKKYFAECLSHFIFHTMKMGDHFYCQAPQKDRSGIKLIKVVLYSVFQVYNIFTERRLKYSTSGQLYGDFWTCLTWLCWQ